MIEPKFAMIPSAVKRVGTPSNAKVYSLLPSDGSGDLFAGNDGFTQMARYNKDLLIEFGDKPRLDWYAKKTCPTLLLEGQRTNLMLWSEDFTANVWVNSGYTVTSNNGISPDGNQTSTLLRSTTSTLPQGISQDVSRGTFNTSYENFSIFVKRAEQFPLNNLVYFQATTVYGAEITLTWDFDNKTLVSNTPTVSILDEASFKELPNGWFRIEARFTMGSSYQTAWKISTVPFGSVYVWGGQFEFSGTSSSNQQEVMPSSYIKTTFNASTRAKDFCRSGSVTPEIFDNSSGTLFVDLESVLENSTNTTFKTIGISKGSSVEDRVFISTATSGLTYFTLIRSQYVSQTSTTTIDRSFRNKMAISWDSNSVRTYVNGVVVFSGSNFYGTPIGLNSFKFASATFQGEFFGEIGDVRYYDSLLSDADLIELTTI